MLTTVPKLFGPHYSTPRNHHRSDRNEGIAELKQVDLNGYPQWVLIRGHDVSNLLFLFLNGGPGESNLWLAHHNMKELEWHFVCVNWDQRGAGKSLLPGPDPATMTIEQLCEDALALIELLLARFGKEKLLLAGHSWGGVQFCRQETLAPAGVSSGSEEVRQ